MNETFDTIIERIGEKFEALQAELATTRDELGRAVIALGRAQAERDHAVAQLDQALADRGRLERLLTERSERGDVIDLTCESPEVLLSDDDWHRLAHSD